jgi:hypothetical protein
MAVAGSRLRPKGTWARAALPLRPERAGAVVLLGKLKLDLPSRALEVISGNDAVTASRMVRWKLERLSEWTWRQRPEPIECYRVDSTTARVRQDKYYSGYQHHRGVKTQVLADKGLVIHHLSAAWPVRAHDKVIWDHTLEQLRPLLERPILAAQLGAADAVLCLPGRHPQGYLYHQRH